MKNLLLLVFVGLVALIVGDAASTDEPRHEQRLRAAVLTDGSQRMPNKKRRERHLMGLVEPMESESTTTAAAIVQETEPGREEREYTPQGGARMMPSGTTTPPESASTSSAEHEASLLLHFVTYKLLSLGFILLILTTVVGTFQYFHHQKTHNYKGIDPTDPHLTELELLQTEE